MVNFIFSFPNGDPAFRETPVKSKSPFAMMACRAWAVATVAQPTGYHSLSDMVGFTSGEWMFSQWKVVYSLKGHSCPHCEAAPRKGYTRTSLLASAGSSSKPEARTPP